MHAGYQQFSVLTSAASPSLLKPLSYMTNTSCSATLFDVAAVILTTTTATTTSNCNSGSISVCQKITLEKETKHNIIVSVVSVGRT
jgi:hypothetical protein